MTPPHPLSRGGGKRDGVCWSFVGSVGLGGETDKLSSWDTGDRWKSGARPGAAQGSNGKRKRSTRRRRVWRPNKGIATTGRGSMLR